MSEQSDGSIKIPHGIGCIIAALSLGAAAKGEARLGTSPFMAASVFQACRHPFMLLTLIYGQKPMGLPFFLPNPYLACTKAAGCCHERHQGIKAP